LTPKTEANKKLGIVEKLSYSAGDMASCLYFGIFMNYLMYYYTDIFGISAGIVGGMILFTRTWDWINDPIMGMVADRTNSKMGKFRPWLLWMLIPWFALGVLTFTAFDMGPFMKICYAVATYTLLTMAYTAINVPYSALMGVMTAKSEERTVLSSFRFVGAFAGTMYVNYTMLYLVDMFGGGNKTLGFSLSVAFYGALSVAFFLITFFGTKERVKPPRTQQKTSLVEDLMAQGKNKPWVMMIVISVMTILWIAIRNSSAIYYFKYLSGDEKLVANFLALGSLAQIFGALATKYITRLFGGKKAAYIGLNVIAGLFIGGFYFIDPHNNNLILGHQILSSFLSAPLMPLFWSMIADTADWGAWKLGHRNTGLVFSAGTASQKIGWSFGPFVASMILVVIGYEANVEQSAFTIEGIRWAMSWIPAVFALLTAVVVMYYQIDAKTEKEMEAAIAKADAENEAAGA